MSHRTDDGPEEARWQRAARILAKPDRRRSARIRVAIDASRNHDASCACKACESTRAA